MKMKMSHPIFSGGFQELILIDNKIKDKVLQEYFNVMIFKDLIETIPEFS